MINRETALDRKTPVLCIVSPCYNEEEVLISTIPQFLDKLTKLEEAGLVSSGSHLLLIDDGSRDMTWRNITAFASKDSRVRGIRLSRNRGHQNALLAGLMEAKAGCDVTISIDCDGQDDLDAMDAMIRDYMSGSEVV